MLFFPPNFIKQVAKSIHQVTEKMTDELKRVSQWVQTGLDKNAEVFNRKWSRF
jgi:hypothetical protein